MNSHPDLLTTSLSQLWDVAPESAEQIWEEFFPRLIRLAQRKLADLPKRTFDEEDVALSALQSFFNGRSQGKFERLHSRDEMWRLLATITVRKASAQRRRMQTAKRGGGQEVGESIFLRRDPAHSSDLAGLANQPDERLLPETTEEILNVCGELLSQLPDEKLRTTAVLRLEGYTNAEIAEQLGCSVARTKQRLQRIREIWGEAAALGSTWDEPSSP